MKAGNIDYDKTRVGYETQGPSPICRAECRARIISIQSKYNLLDKVHLSKAQKYHILREKHEIFRKIMTYGQLIPFVYYFDRFSNLHFEEPLLLFA